MSIMNIRHSIRHFIDRLAAPIARNACFFTWMYVLGIVVSVLELPAKKDATLYGNLWLELLLDLYLLCVVLTLLPRKVRSWVRGLCAGVAYAVGLADVFCYWKFGSALTPTMLLLVGETNGNEASEFLSTYLNADVLFSPVGWLLLLAILHAVTAFLLPWCLKKWAGRPRISSSALQRLRTSLGVVLLPLLLWSAIASWHNKCEMVRMFTQTNIGQVEHELTRSDCAQFYQPIYRLAFSIFSNELAAQQVEKLIEAKDHLRVNGCSYRVPNIVLIIGESYGKHHSQQYGYPMPTTPRQIAWEKTGQLVPFTDVVAPWNLTSFVFKNLFSLHVVGQKGEWCDYPLFPELFRKAGYHTAFITNQFLPKAKEAVYDFSGGFFLNHPELSEAMFDSRNDRTYSYDEGLLAAYDDHLKAANARYNLIIFHLMGQHVNYRQRYPKERKHFKADDYETLRPELNHYQRRVLSEYDNAILYNDSIVDQIVRRFSTEDAIVIYVPDHGEECFEGNRGFICRNHSAAIDYDLAHYEFEIPLWIWCSRPFMAQHKDLVEAIRAAKDRRYMTDALPHTLLYLAGIRTPEYHAEYDILSQNYWEKRPRILKNQTDYDQLRPKQRPAGNSSHPSRSKKQ